MEPAEEKQLLTQVAELRSDVRHLQSGVTEIKSRFDKVDKQFDKVEQRFKDIETKTEERFKGVDKALNEIRDMIASAKLWAYGLYLGGVFTLLYVIARGAKWL
jgi:septal ring factor EnvC (AmiA/AmiB activator)